VQNYDYPSKNWVRSWLFATIDRLVPPKTKESRQALYLPSLQNLEGPYFEERGIITYPVERREDVIAKMATLRKRVFHGTVTEWTTSHANHSGPRLHIANLDYEGQLNTFATELIGLFRIFPSRQGGVLSLTTFANMDPESVESGIVHANAFDSILGGQVRQELHTLHRQLEPYLEGRAHSDAIAHAQFSRDFGVLWRVLMGLALWDSPTEGPGSLRETLYRELTILIGGMHKEVERIQRIGENNTFSFVHEAHLHHLLNTVSTPLFPLCLERVLYRSVGNNRMSTWIIYLGRLHTEMPLTKVVEQLWQLYRHSPLTFVSPSGSLHTYRPR
jgi:hypothetical protein